VGNSISSHFWAKGQRLIVEAPGILRLVPHKIFFGLFLLDPVVRAGGGFFLVLCCVDREAALELLCAAQSVTVLRDVV